MGRDRGGAAVSGNRAWRCLELSTSFHVLAFQDSFGAICTTCRFFVLPLVVCIEFANAFLGVARFFSGTISRFHSCSKYGLLIFSWHAEMHRQSPTKTWRYRKGSRSTWTRPAAQLLRSCSDECGVLFFVHRLLRSLGRTLTARCSRLRLS